MTASAAMRRAAAENQGFFTRVWRWVKVTIWRVVFGQTEWHHICGAMGNHVDEQDRMARFRTSLALSSALVGTCNAVFDFESFPVDATLNDMTKRLQLDTSDMTLVSNLRTCLHRCNFVNRVYARALALRDESYSSANAQHEARLEQLWANLKPNVRRSGGRITKEWGEIGFQGTDPMSDFRGMGLLSLHQLVHFSAKYPIEAQAALAESNHPTRWYPFSVTGINITGFVIELINERLVDCKLYAVTNPSDSTSDDAVEQGVIALHELYSTLFTRFNKTWVDANPRDVMAFPTIFQSLKDSVRRELTQRSFKY